MTVSKLTNNVKPLDEVDKINEIIDELDNIDPLPSQTGQSGKYLTTNGTVPSWADVQSLPSQTGKAGKFLQTDGTDASWESAPFRNIGEIVPSTIPLTDAGLHLLDGALIQGDGIYSAFVDYIAGLVSTYPNLFVTESAWQTAVSTYGVCGKFVYDSTNNTVRLPKITGIIEGTTDVTALGDLVEAGLPNITGTFTPSILSGTGSSNYWSLPITSATGAFGTIGSGTRPYYTSAGTSTATHKYGGNFDASRSSSIYGNSNTVQPQSIKGFLYIVIATSTKTDVEVDLDQVATDLNGKVNTSDLAEVQCVIETYSNGTSWYRVYSDGWCEQGGRGTITTSGSGTITFLKPFANTNYSLNLTKTSSDSSSWTVMTYILSNTNSTAVIKANLTGYTLTVLWQACGYII